jgi:hypothetical protein
MRNPPVAWVLAGLVTALAGCGRAPWTYTQAFVAKTDAGPVLVLLDNNGNDWVSTVAIAGGTRSERSPLGAAGSCLPASPGRIWCGYTDGDDVYEHEAWDLGTLQYLADNSTIIEHAPDALTLAHLQINPGLEISRVGHALVINSADENLPEPTFWAVDPVTFGVSAFTYDDSTDVLAPGLPGEEISALTEYRVGVGAHDYWIDEDTGHLVTAPTGSESWKDVGPATFPGGRFVLADGYDAAAGPLVAQDPESVFVVAPLDSYFEKPGYRVARVGTADGKVIWKAEHADAQSVDTTASAGGVLALVMRVTPWAGPNEVQAPIHARAVGIDLASGAVRWGLDL